LVRIALHHQSGRYFGGVPHFSVVWEWFEKGADYRRPMFKNFNFASASLMLFMLGILLFSSLVLMPQFLQTLLGYTSELAGWRLSAGGLVLLIETPITGQLTQKFRHAD
jgi:DHA2 family multidrug resistance protein